MAVPPSDERREILQPSLLPVPGHTGAGEETTSDQYCVSNGVRDGAGLAVINNITNIIKASLHLKLLLCGIFKWEALILTPIICYQSSCLPNVSADTSHEVSAGVAAAWCPGDMAPSRDIQGESLLPGARVW